MLLTVLLTSLMAMLLIPQVHATVYQGHAEAKIPWAAKIEKVTVSRNA